ncbi:MAG: hypothetical protein L6Q97_04015 [Thermoanaerobaculia bacterium]|nr:hypothetical protein [Thermoanaerobaculia bacterium]
MHTHSPQHTDNSSQAVANALPQSGTGPESVSPLTDRRPETVAEQALQMMAGNSPGARRQKTLQAIADKRHEAAISLIAKPQLAAPVIQGVFLPYEAPPEGAKAATLESYMRLIKFRQGAVARTMGKEWLVEQWKDLLQSKAQAPVDQTLDKVQQFIGAVLGKIARNEDMRKEIQPWQDDGDMQARALFYQINLHRWAEPLGNRWVTIETLLQKLQETGKYDRMCSLAEASAKEAGGDINALYIHFKSFQHLLQELTTRKEFLEEKIPKWAESWPKIRLQAAVHLKAQQEDQAHAYLEKIVNGFVNPNLKKTAEPKDVIRPMPVQEQKEVMTLFKKEIGTAIEIVKALRENDQVLGMVFLSRGTEIEDVKKDLTAVEAQLWEWRWQKKSKVILDKAGTSAAGGTTATANQSTGTLDLTRGWAEKPTSAERQQTLIHEASHASAVKTKDLAYMWGWAYSALSGREKRRNADSYAEAAGKLLGADLGLKELTFKNKPEQSGEKSSPKTPLTKESPLNNPEFLVLAKKGLGEMDRLLARARTLSGNMAKLLKEKPENTMDQKWWEFARMLDAPFTSVPWAENKTKAEYGVTNADLETLMLFRDSLKYVHDLIGEITGLEILPGTGAVAVNADTLSIGQLLIQSIGKPEDLAAQMIRQLYLARNPGLPWSADVAPAVDKIVNMNPNWREIEPVLPEQKEGMEKMEPSGQNAAALKILVASEQKMLEWWKKFYPDQQKPKPPFFVEANTISANLEKYVKIAQEKLRSKTRRELVISNAVQELETFYNEIGNTLASAKKGLVPQKNDTQWKQLKELGTIAYESREAWIGRPEKK